MSPTSSVQPTTRWRWALRAVAMAVTVVTAGTVAVVGVNAVLLGQVNDEVQLAQSRSLNLSNSLRETLLLRQEITELGETSTMQKIDIQRGLMFRQIAVTIAVYPPDSLEAAELEQVRKGVSRFPWDRLAALGGRGDPLRQSAMALVGQSEQRIHGLHMAQEQQFYAATIASIDAARRGQIGSAVLVVLVLLLGGVGIAVVTQRGRSALAVAFRQLEEEVMERRAAEEALFHQAHHDALTRLPNRTLLLDRLREALRTCPATAAVILVDLDGFKNVNDTLGHPAGDELLFIAAQRLIGCLREGDMAARLGGDEFAVLVFSDGPSSSRNGSAPVEALTTGGAADLLPARTEDVDGPVAVGRRIVDVLRKEYRVAGHGVRVTASVGIRRVADGDSAEDLLRDADIAMYAAKNTGKGRVEVFDPEMRARAARRTSMQQELARAVDLGEIEAHFQPIIDLQTLRPTTLEALARWRRDDRAPVTAEEFIAVAEESGSIMEVGRAVLRQACHAAQAWRRLPGHGDLVVAVNVSMQQVLSGHLAEHVTEALSDSGLPPEALILEITESAAVDDSEIVGRVFSGLRRSGIRLAVDDFGSGYSSLAGLMRLPADILKIDRTLLDFVTTRDGSLVTAVAELGRTLGLVVVVEGVETQDHLARAREAGCDAAQGFHFSRPLAPADVPAYLGGWPAPWKADSGAARG